MKYVPILLVLFFMVGSCSTNIPNSTKNNSISFEKNEEDDEYDIIVFDSQYDLFLLTQAKPKSFYSENYYKSKNRIYVSEWNSRNLQPMRYNPDLYAVQIDYNPTKEYGLNLEYKLYNFFKFIEWKYKVNLDF